jgi:hypothetical protein
MTQFEELESGRELDTLIAEKVMDEPIGPCPGDSSEWSDYEYHWVCEVCRELTRMTIVSAHARRQEPYSTEIAAAWRIVEKLGLSVIQYATDDWVAGSFGEAPAGNEFYIDDHFEYSGEGSTAPLAICRAALNRPKAT